MNEKPICYTYMTYKEWWLGTTLHREDGPAIEWRHGGKEWYLNNIKYTEEAYWKELFKRGLITKKELFLKLL